MAEVKIDPIGKLIDFGLGVVTNLLGGLFGKSKTRKAIADMSQDAAYLQTIDAKQGKIITGLLIGLGVAVIGLLFFLLKR